MDTKEAMIWQKINNVRKTKLSPEWLGEAYTSSDSLSLRIAIAEQLGFLSKEGWITLKQLLKTHGLQPELIQAAGACHQQEAKSFLLQTLKKENEMNIVILEALACWGASISEDLIKRVLREPALRFRLAGLELLKFKAHQLNDSDLLWLSKELLSDIREQVVIKTIKILQRRDSIDICNSIGTVALHGTDCSAEVALMALGSIGSMNSKKILKELANKLPKGRRLDLTKKQILHQSQSSSTL